MIEMSIDSIRVSMMNYQRVVILKEKIDETSGDKSDTRYLPIWIGPAEADAIAVKLQNVPLARPLTHDLLQKTISIFETASISTFSKIVINDLRSDTFYAQIIFEFEAGPPPVTVKPVPESTHLNEFVTGSKLSLVWQETTYIVTVTDRWQRSGQVFIEADNGDGLIFVLCGKEMNQKWLLIQFKLDSRPSDAIALAVRVKPSVPIYVEESVLDKASIILDQETGKPMPPSKPGGKPKGKSKVDEQELKKLSAFYDFINTLDLEDFDKHKS